MQGPRKSKVGTEPPAHQVAPRGRAEHARASGAVGHVLTLQRVAGNRAVAGLVQSQTKDQPQTGDRLRSSLQMRLDASPGEPLDQSIRTEMESRLRHDFGGVSVHSDGKTAGLANAFDALAFTVGRHIVFAPGQYTPSTSSGRALIAHELAHVVHQDTVGPRVQLAERSAPGLAGTQASSIRLQLTVYLEDVASGVTISIDWKHTGDLPEDVNRVELDGLIRKARDNVVERSPGLLRGKFTDKRVVCRFALSGDALRTEQSRDGLVKNVEGEIRKALNAVRVPEKRREPAPSPREIAATAAALTQRIQRIRDDMAKSLAEQATAEGFTAFMSSEEELKLAEKAISEGRLENAKTYVRIAEIRWGDTSASSVKAEGEQSPATLSSASTSVIDIEGTVADIEEWQQGLTDRITDSNVAVKIAAFIPFFLLDLLTTQSLV